MSRRPWFESHEVAAKTKADRVAGRPVAGTFTIGQGGQVTDPIRYDELPVVDRSVHMPPAETSHPGAIERARGAVADRVDTAIARSVGWLLSRSGLGR